MAFYKLRKLGEYYVFMSRHNYNLAVKALLNNERSTIRIKSKEGAVRGDKSIWAI